ncbi:MAG: Gfo/Idh/MocA family oxidoreductase [Acidobacteriaceae bacterium]|nr:Gfo/Idh/MocA family oxidoreductase [Acidobacteriaceae bacterium]MBV9767040.1 Gfo/Idh/MocA family oxidoreductase [Acidobacteriaceae bacterium]
MNKLRAAVVGAGSFGRNHARVISQLPDVELAAVVDVDLAKADKLAGDYVSLPFASATDIPRGIDAAVIATPTSTHERIASELLEAGIDLLVEKPIADSSEAGERLARLAQERGRVLQAGHLERFNPAVTALEKALTIPLFFEIHRLSVFTPRSLDVDVILDLMIHDLDIVLSFTREEPEEIRAAGISILSGRVDIANVRLSFPSGCIANLTASRVSTEKIRKLRLFQPGEYISLDYERQDAVRLAVLPNEPKMGSFLQIGFKPLPVERAEPLKLELEGFFHAVRERSAPKVDGFAAAKALRVAEAILAKIKEHGDLVSETVRQHGKRS